MKPLFKVCPKCESKAIDHSTTAALWYRYDDNGKFMGQRLSLTDAGTTRCRKCGHEESP